MIVAAETGTNPAIARAHAHAHESSHGEVEDELLRSYVDRAISLKELITSTNSDLSDLYKEASSRGLDKTALKECVKITMEDADKRAKRLETDDVLSVYLAALGLA